MSGASPIQQQGTICQSIEPEGTQPLVVQCTQPTAAETNEKRSICHNETMPITRDGTQAVTPQQTIPTQQYESTMPTSLSNPDIESLAREGTGVLTSDQAEDGEASFKETYTVLDKLGEGSYASVFKCQHVKDRDFFAVKMLDKAKAGTAELHELMHEANIMRGLLHPSVIALRDQFEGKQYIYLIIDYVEGSTLFDRIIAAEHFSEEIAAAVFKNLLLAIQHIHSSGIIHRDLKPENLLMKHRAHHRESPDYFRSMTDVVVADFGLATRPPASTCCGSPAYVAPEVISCVTSYDYSCDVWSLGIILYVMLAGAFPFKGKTHEETFHQTLTRPVMWKPLKVWEKVSTEAKGLLSRILNKNPENRESADTALHNTWITGELLEHQLRARKLHMTSTVSALKKFSLREKINTAMTVFKATRLISPLTKTTTKTEVPCWRKYLIPSDDNCSLIIKIQSQTTRYVHPPVLVRGPRITRFDNVFWSIRQKKYSYLFIFFLFLFIFSFFLKGNFL